MRVGIVGWRGMVGSVLLERMRAEGDFERIETTFFSTSQAGEPGPDMGTGSSTLRDANDPAAFAGLDAVISCQGGDYTKAMHPQLRKSGFSGYWIDAASALRMRDDAVIVLDPVNRKQIDAGLDKGLKDFIGGNCTVSLMLMAIAGLYEQGWVEWISASTYQAASGAGAQAMRQLLQQMSSLQQSCGAALSDPASHILDLDRQVTACFASPSFPVSDIGAPLAGALIPWIDTPMDNGQTREEWKANAEGNKIMGCQPPVPVDGICVRVGAMRCHSQALTIKLTKDVPLDEVEAAIQQQNDWVRVIPNERAASVSELSPAKVSGTLQVPIGRLRRMNLGPEFVCAFTVGDQLLWGAAEPLRRMLNILLERT